MTIIQGYRCHWCGSQYQKNEFGPTACSKEHLEKLRGSTNSELYTPGQTVYVPLNQRTEIKKRIQLKLWGKIVNHQYAAAAAIFELITGFKPPRMRETADIISGHIDTKA